MNKSVSLLLSVLISITALGQGMAFEVTTKMDVAVDGFVQSVQLVKTDVRRNGARVQYVKTKNGDVRKRILKPATSNYSIKKNHSESIVKPLTKTGTETFYESFEDWNGSDYDWLPTNWGDVSKRNHKAPGASSKRLNLTWCTIEPRDDDPIDGKYTAYIQVSYDDDSTGDKEEMQDEWLITPAFTPKADENFFFNYADSPGWTLINVDDLAFTSENAHLEVYISTDNGKTWGNPVFNSLDVCHKYSENELWESCYAFSHTWHFQGLKMSSYVGKSIRVAFRYVGKGGESILIDEVTCKVARPTAYYSRPKGALYTGYNTTYHALTNNYVVAAPYTNLTWTSACGIETEKWTWYKFDVPTEQYYAYQTNSLADYSNPITSLTPGIIASAVGADDVLYQRKGYVRYGGDVIVNTGTADVPKYESWGLGNYDKDLKFVSWKIREGQYLYGTGSQGWWTEQLSDALNAKKVWIHAIGNYFAEHAAPYTFTTLNVMCGVKMNPESEMKAELFSMVDGEISSTPKYVATCKMSDVIISNNDNNYCCMPFRFTEYDETSGTYKPVTVVADGDFFIKVSGYENFDGVNEWFEPYQTYEDPVDKEVNAYEYIRYKTDVTDEETGEVHEQTRELFYTSGLNNLYSSYLFSLDAVFPWLVSEHDQFLIPDEGTVITEPLDSYYTGGEFRVADWEGNPLPKWLFVSMYNTYDDNMQITGTNMEIYVPALPKDYPYPGRECFFNVMAAGVMKTFYVVQGQSGVSKVTSSDATTLAFANGKVVTYHADADGYVNVVNMRGQVKKVPVKAGVNTFEIETAGIYLVGKNKVIIK